MRKRKTRSWAIELSVNSISVSSGPGAWALGASRSTSTGYTHKEAWVHDLVELERLAKACISVVSCLLASWGPKLRVSKFRKHAPSGDNDDGRNGGGGTSVPGTLVMACGSRPVRKWCE